MKKILYLLFLLFTINEINAQHGIGVVNPNASAAWEINSTTKGILLPRLTTSEMNGISSPALGLMIYNTDLNCIHYYFGGWKSQCDPANLGAWGILGNSGTVEATNFIGTRDSRGVRFRTNNIERMTITSAGDVGIGTTSPDAKFQVAGQITVGTGSNSYLKASYNGELLTGVDATSYYFAAGLGSGSALPIRYGDNNAYQQWFTSGAERMRIISSGNVGIGLTAPTAQLHVFNSDIKAGTFRLTTGSGGHPYLTSTGGTSLILKGELATNIGHNVNISGTHSVTIGNGDSRASILGLFNAANSEVVRVSDNGNMGIGIVAPGYKLDINATSNPLRMSGLQLGTVSDSVLTVSSAVVRRMRFSDMIGASAWALDGNTNAALKSIGTRDAYDLPFIINNTERMRLTGTGLGIGTATPLSKLHIAQTASGELARIRIEGGIKNPGLFLSADETTGEAALSFGGSVGFYGQVKIGSTNVMTFANNTNVGIGTTTPSFKLDINGNPGNIGNPLRLQGLLAGASTDSLLTSNAGVVRRFSANQFVQANAWGLLGNGGTIEATNFIGTTDNIGVRFRTNNLERMTITNGGNVGIGTTAAQAPLQVYTAPDADLTATSGGLVVGATTATNIVVDDNEIMARNNGAASVLSLQADGGALAIHTNAAGAGDDVYISGSGDVGLGMTAPAHKLDIVSASNPLRMSGLQLGTTADSMLTVSSAVVKRMKFSDMVAGNAWGLLGNASTVDGTNFIGTTDNIPLNFRVNGLRAGRIDPTAANTFFGYQAGNATTGINNSFFGYEAGNATSTGVGNIALGYRALKANLTGSYNIAIGTSALLNYTGAAAMNIGIGPSALGSTTGGVGNVVLGRAAGFDINITNTSDGYNTIIGANSGRGLVTGYNNTIIGANINSLPSNLIGNVILADGQGVQRLNIDVAGTVTIAKLDIAGTANPLRMSNLQLGTVADSVLTVSSAVVKRMKFSDMIGASAWALDGNTNGAIKSIGTKDSYDLPFITANTEKMRILTNGNVGLGTTTPNTKLDVDGAIALRPTATSVTLDNQVVTVGNRSFLRLTADGTPANRTITLSNGLQDGQQLVIRVSAGGANGLELADSGNLNLSGTAMLDDGDTITLIWDGSFWFEMHRSNN